MYIMDQLGLKVIDSTEENNAPTVIYVVKFACIKNYKCKFIVFMFWYIIFLRDKPCNSNILIYLYPKINDNKKFLEHFHKAYDSIITTKLSI